MDFIYRYGIVIFFVISTALSLLLVQQNTIFTKNNNLFKSLYFFLYMAFTYNIISLSQNFLNNITLYYITLLFMMSFLSYRFIVVGGILTPVIVSVYFSFLYPSYSFDMASLLIVIGLIGMLGLLIVFKVAKIKPLMYLCAAIVMAIVEYYQNSLMVNGIQVIYQPVQISLTFVDNIALGLFVYFASKFITEKTAELQTKLASYDRDDLTGLYNFRQLNQDILKVAPSDAYELTVIIVDIDHFKNLNDTHGHSHGNEILKFVADTIKQVITKRFSRQQYRVYRYGGEEIVIALQGHVTEIAQILDELKSITSQKSIALYNENLTLSIGVSFNKYHHFDNLETFRRADELLYKVKTNSRNSYLIDN